MGGCMDKKNYKDMLDDVCSDDCSNEDCVLKEFLISSHPSPRLLIQLKCIQRFKNLQENVKCFSMSWAEAINEWVKSGKAKKFNEVYEEDRKYLSIYKEIMKD